MLSTISSSLLTKKRFIVYFSFEDECPFVSLKTLISLQMSINYDYTNFFVFLADIAMDWSDHAMWWPAKNIWLDKTRWTLDQYNITADAIIYFTPMHKTLRIQLPDLRYIDCQVDFSVKTFNACVNLCKELGIRYPEELSLCKPLEPEHLKQNYQVRIYFFLVYANFFSP